jgi:23S rRNA (cytosine1962-C5)-methyltransferase
LTKLFLKKNEEHRILNGHQWVFSNEIAKIDGPAESGDLIDVHTSAGSKLGSGFYNKNSLIAVRILHNSFDGNLSEFFRKLILTAYNYRKSIYPQRNSYRLVFSESDYLPGLIIDKYNDTYVLQVYCFGMQKNINQVVNVLKDVLNAKNIFSRNESYFRRLEGLPEENELYSGSIENEEINDGKISYNIDFTNSQKTGFYFDQYDNREFIEKLVNGKSVLDAFCNSGGFGMHAVFAGAKSITFADSSKTELENAKSNYELNKLDAEPVFIESDIFDYLNKCINENGKFDVVMIDPPAFAKSKKSVPSALKGYAKLNKLALSCIAKNGYLVSSSCSNHINESDFLDAIAKAAAKTGKTIQLIYRNGASLDHPQIPAMEETSYLKFAVFLVS